MGGGFVRLLLLLSSRRLAVYLLVTVILLLVLSSLLPSEMGLSVGEWRALQVERPLLFRLSDLLSTPRLVRNPLFIGLSSFLFLTTLTCTITRLRSWYRTCQSEFEKERSFSFSLAGEIVERAEDAAGRLREKLLQGGWSCREKQENGIAHIEATKGSRFGFWGSMVFHAGLIICFLAVPVTALTVFRAEFMATRGVPTRFPEGLISREGSIPPILENMELTINELKGTYAEGRYKLDFSGSIAAAGEEHPFAVNRPALIGDSQFTLHEYGYAPFVTLALDGKTFFESYLNVHDGPDGDLFDLQERGIRLHAVFLPDFIRENGRVGTRSNQPRNPVLFVRVLQGQDELAGGLVSFRSSSRIGPFDVGFHELSRWGNFIVVREKGIEIIGLGSLICVAGLLLRFVSNERILDVEIRMAGTAGTTTIRLLGYSKYYPAFLEREIREVAGRIGMKA